MKPIKFFHAYNNGDESKLNITYEDGTTATFNISAYEAIKLNATQDRAYLDKVVDRIESPTPRTYIAQRILEIRKEKGIMQSELAEKVGISQQHLSRIERGEYAVRIDILERLAAVMNCRLDIIKND